MKQLASSRAKSGVCFMISSGMPFSQLAESWNTYKDTYVKNPIAADRLNWGNYDLVVIDESHNFRNGAGTHANTQENRYIKLMDKVIRAGVRTKVLMLSTTPVNKQMQLNAELKRLKRELEAMK